MSKVKVSSISPKHKEVTINTDKIVCVGGVEGPQFKVYFENAVWYLPEKEYEKLMSEWLKGE